MSDTPEPTSGDSSRDHQDWWEARVAALSRLYGPADTLVGHAVIPFEAGPELGGGADVVHFKTHLPGVLAVTSELIGRDDQVPNTLGNYELAVCTRADESWAPVLISRLAHYTLQARLDPGETMDIGPALPEGSSIAALLFFDFGRFTVRDRDAGVLLAVGITADELRACRRGRRSDVEKALRGSGVFPFTDLRRRSVLEKKRSSR